MFKHVTKTPGRKPNLLQDNPIFGIFSKCFFLKIRLFFCHVYVCVLIQSAKNSKWGGFLLPLPCKICLLLEIVLYLVPAWAKYEDGDDNAERSSSLSWARGSRPDRERLAGGGLAHPPPPPALAHTSSHWLSELNELGSSSPTTASLLCSPSSAYFSSISTTQGHSNSPITIFSQLTWGVIYESIHHTWSFLKVSCRTCGDV